MPERGPRCVVTLDDLGRVPDPLPLCSEALDLFKGQIESLFLGVVDGKTKLVVIGLRHPDHSVRFRRLLETAGGMRRVSGIGGYSDEVQQPA